MIECAAARCRDAVVANGGCAAVVASCAPGCESALLLIVAASLRRCGAAHAERALEENVFLLLATKVTRGRKRKERLGRLRCRCLRARRRLAAPRAVVG